MNVPSIYDSFCHIETKFLLILFESIYKTKDVVCDHANHSKETIHSNNDLNINFNLTIGIEVFCNHSETTQNLIGLKR